MCDCEMQYVWAALFTRAQHDECQFSLPMSCGILVLSLEKGKVRLLYVRRKGDSLYLAHG